MASTYTINNNLTNPITIDTSNIPSIGTITLNSGGTSGTYISSSSSTYSSAWVNPTTNFTSSSGKSIMTVPYGEDKIVLEEKATLEVNGNVVINGMDLDERLKTIEQVLCIPQRDVTMEAKYPKLKKLYHEYMKELEKYKTWDRVKGDDNGTT